MSELSVAIIGGGNIAGGYDEGKADNSGIYSHAGAYSSHGGFRLDAVFDLDRERAELFRRKWGISRYASSLKDILTTQHDVISICTPDDTHFPILREVLAARCCRSVFVEKPLAGNLDQIEEICRLAAESQVRVVVNFQRRVEPVHAELREAIATRRSELLSVSGCYMKGLQHIGVTMIDTLTYLCGNPAGVLAFNRILNQEVGEQSYEFVLYYPGLTVTVKTTDAERFVYSYHIFEIDLLFRDGRKALVDISQGLRESPVTSYAYPGVKVLSERQSSYRETGYKLSMLNAIKYVFDVTAGKTKHTVNTPESSYNNQLIMDAIAASFDRGLVKMNFEPGQWKS